MTCTTNSLIIHVLNPRKIKPRQVCIDISLSSAMCLSLKKYCLQLFLCVWVSLNMGQCLIPVVTRIGQRTKVSISMRRVKDKNITELAKDHQHFKQDFLNFFKHSHINYPPLYKNSPVSSLLSFWYASNSLRYVHNEEKHWTLNKNQRKQFSYEILGWIKQMSYDICSFHRKWITLWASCKTKNKTNGQRRKYIIRKPSVGPFGSELEVIFVLPFFAIKAISVPKSPFCSAWNRPAALYNHTHTK